MEHEPRAPRDGSGTRRTLGTVTAGALVAGTFTAIGLATAAPAAAAVQLKNDYNYKCDVNAAGLGLGVKNVGINAAVQVPRSVEAGQTLAPRKTQITLTMPEDLRAATVGMLEAKTAGGSSSDAAITITAPGVADPLEVPIGNLSAPQTDVPTAKNARWTIPTEGDVPAITVPASATDTATLRMPARFTVDATLIQADGTIVGGEGAVKMDCALDASGPNGDGVFGEIPIVPAGTPLTARDIDWKGPVHQGTLLTGSESGRIPLKAVGGTGEDVAYEVVSQPAKGSVSIDGDEAVVKHDNVSTFGAYSFTYRATGENGQVSAPATVSYELTNAQPRTRTLTFSTTKDKPLDVWPWARDRETGDGPFVWSDGGKITYGEAQHGTVAAFFVEGDASVDPRFVESQHKATYVPDAGFVGKDSFTYTLTDKHGATSTGKVNVDVTAKPAAEFGVLKDVRYRCAFAVRATDGMPDPAGEPDPVLSDVVSDVMGGDVTFRVDTRAHLPKTLTPGQKLNVPDTDIALKMAQPMAELLAGADISQPAPLDEAGFGQTAVQGKASADAVFTESATGKTYAVPMTGLTSAQVPLALPVPSSGIAIPVKGGIREITAPQSGSLTVSMPSRFFIDANLTPGVLGGFIKAVGLDCTAMEGENLTIATAPVVAPSKVAASAPSVRYGTAAPKVSVSVAPGAATGTVEVRKGSTVLGKASVVKGKASVTLLRTALKPGSHALSVRYSGDAKHQPSTGTVRLSVTKAKATVAAKVTTKKVVAKKTRAKVRVTVKAPGVKPGGTVAVYAKGKKVGTAKVGASGVVTVRLKKLPKAGKVTLSVRYLGDATTGAATRTIKVTVRKR